MTTQDNALSQAIAQANSIAAMVVSLTVDYDRLEELRDELESLEADVKDARIDKAPDADYQEVLKALVEWRNDNAEELEELSEAAGDCKDADDAREAIQNDPLDLQVRSGWYNPCERSNENNPSEFMILLCTGGPAVRIMGELDDNMQPCRAWIEAQDWGTPWTHAVGVIEQSVLLEYCQQFYFGE